MNTLLNNCCLITKKSIRTICSLFLLFFCISTLQTQTSLKVRDVFKQMPDSILPYLTTNNRLDMLDFKDSHMQARVQNKFDGYSEMLTLADDSLTIQMNGMMRLTLRMVTSSTEVDGSCQLICLERAYKHAAIDTNGNVRQKTITHQDFYSILWRKLSNDFVGLVK